MSSSNILSTNVDKPNVKVETSPLHLWNVYDRNSGRFVIVPSKVLLSSPEQYLVPAVDPQTGKHTFSSIKSARKVAGRETQCVLTDSKTHLFQISGGVLTHNTGGGKSVMQRNVVFHCIAHPNQIKMFGIDLKRVELSVYEKYSNAILGVATTLEDAVEILRFSQETMMDRYSDMEQAGVQNFLDLPEPGCAILVMVDEAGELLDMSAPAKAIADNTIMPSIEHGTTGLARDVQVGDHVLGEDNKWHTVLDRYEPKKQKQYSFNVQACNLNKIIAANKTENVENTSVTAEVSNSIESVTVGSEHLWTIITIMCENTVDWLKNNKIKYNIIKNNDSGSLNCEVQAVLKSRGLKYYDLIEATVTSKQISWFTQHYSDIPIMLYKDSVE